jgi:predicted phosphodiesterase
MLHGTKRMRKMKIAVISDGHLFQSPSEEYDSISDLRRAIGQLKNLKPDLIIFTGDMFDYKRTPSTFVRHYEGEGAMVGIRPTLEELRADIFAIRGNHERAEVLKSLDQTVRNFHYLGDTVIRRDGVGIWLLDTRYEEGAEEGEKAIEKACSEAKKEKLKTKILVTHETLRPYDGAIQDKTVKAAAETFDFVLDGHMHLWSSNHLGIKNLYLLPALLPSRLIFGSYWVERYSWEPDQAIYSFESRSSPFGFVVLESDGQMPEFVPFEPSRQTVDVSLGIDGITLEEAKRRLREMLAEVARKKGNRLVLPEIHGESNFLPVALKSIFSEFDLPMAEVRINAKFSPALRKRLELAIRSVGDIYELIRNELPKIVEKKGKGLDPKSIIDAFNRMLEEGLLEKPPARVDARLRALLEPMLEGVRKPEYFEQDLQEILKIKGGKL